MFTRLGLSRPDNRARQLRRGRRAAVALLALMLASCGGDEQAPTAEQPSTPGWASLLAAREKLAGGSDDVALSADGTWRYRRQRSGVDVTGEQITRSAKDVLSWTHAGVASSGAADGRSDGINERRYEITRGSGVDGTIVITDDPQDDGTPVFRTTYARSGDSVHVVVERADASGALAVAEQFDTTAKQALGPSTPSSAFHSSCRADDVERLTPIVIEGVTKGMLCLQRLGLDKELALLAGKLGSQGLEVRCDSLPNNECAEVDFTDSLLRGAISGPIGITVDTNTFFNNVFCGGNQASGIFHELMHVPFGPHSPGAKPSKDRVYSCQRLCFNAEESSPPQVTQCQCATCLGTSECDKRCVGFPPCSDPPPECGPKVTIDDVMCPAASCSCDKVQGKRWVQQMRGTVSGPVGTLLQVNAAALLGGTLDCGEWSPADCPVAGILKCCQRTSDAQPEQASWLAGQPTPPVGCVCPPVALPGINWIAQGHLDGYLGVEVERTGATCQ